MARNKDNRFGVADGFDFDDKYEDQKVKEENTRNIRGISQEEAEKGTQGRKGMKMPRINMAFEPELHEWIKKTSRQEGLTMTEFVNDILRKDMYNRR